MEGDIENEAGGEGGRGPAWDEKEEEDMNLSHTSLPSIRDDEEFSTIRQPLLRSRINTTSQIAIVGANLSPIESLDYEYDDLFFIFY